MAEGNKAIQKLAHKVVIPFWFAKNIGCPERANLEIDETR